MMVRLILRPTRDDGRFTAHLAGEHIVTSDQPVVDGARELLRRGYNPATPLTACHDGSAHDAFKPLSIGEWARWTYSDTNRDGLRRQAWRPRPSAEGSDSPTGEAKSGVSAVSDVPQAHDRPGTHSGAPAPVSAHGGGT